MTDRTLTRRELSTSALIATGLAFTGQALRSSAQAPNDGKAATEAATTSSDFEITGNIWPLYQRMHSDSRGVVPFYAVDYWYANDFTPRGPELIEATGVEFVDWTWEVTGTTYPGTAEVAFTQTFADGSSVEDVVRLVLEDGELRWFFGRSRGFVDEQIALAESDIFPPGPSVAPDWAEALVGLGIEALDNLPKEYSGEQDATIRTGADDGGGRGRVYVTSEFYSVAAIYYQTLGPNQKAVDVIQFRLDAAENVPSFKVLAWDLTPDTSLPFATYQTYAGEVNANSTHAIVASHETGNLWDVSASDEGAIDTLG